MACCGKGGSSPRPAGRSCPLCRAPANIMFKYDYSRQKNVEVLICTNTATCGKSSKVGPVK